MKLAVAVADARALPSAFVVWRGLEPSIRKAADMGYDGIELALEHPDQVNKDRLAAWLAETGTEVSCISTGQVYAALGLSLTDPDPAVRTEAVKLFQRFIDLAAEFSRMVNIGRVRGAIGSRDKGEVEGLFVDTARALCAHAARRGVTLALEPVNRYELDFVNNVEQGVALVKQVGMDNFKLMPDVFHMNIEDVTIEGELARHIKHIAYVHFADSNRLAPGQGHTDFGEIVGILHRCGYDGWIAVEILPQPDPDTAAGQAIAHLSPLLGRL
jgi:sugar phosphate isomerase/epimerase